VSGPLESPPPEKKQDSIWISGGKAVAVIVAWWFAICFSYGIGVMGFVFSILYLIVYLILLMFDVNIWSYFTQAWATVWEWVSQGWSWVWHDLTVAWYWEPANLWGLALIPAVLLGVVVVGVVVGVALHPSDPLRLRAAGRSAVRWLGFDAPHRPSGY
jgi:hypothetical protein